MTDDDFLVIVYRQQADLLGGYLSDFSDADMLVRPCPGANHAAWQLGHLAVSTTNLLNMAKPGSMKTFPPEIASRFGKGGAPLDEGFGTKDELLEQFYDVNDAAVEWLKNLTPEEMRTPTDPKMHGFAKTVGHLAQMIPVHIMMHLGQIQVIRRKLGKPILM